MYMVEVGEVPVAAMKEKNRADRIRRSLEEGKCAWCSKLIPGWPDKKGVGDKKHGRFCSVSCLGSMHGTEFVERHKKRLKVSQN